MSSSHALREAALEIEKYVAKDGWDGPVRLFALVNTQKALRENPALRSELPPATAEKARLDSESLFSVEQDALPAFESIGELLAQIMWPADIDGAAVSMERIVLPPAAENELPEEAPAALKKAANHPLKQEVRIVCAVLRDGTSWNAVRMKAHDSDDMVLSGENIVSGLTQALRATFTP